MSYGTTNAREQLLGAIAEAADQLGVALASLGEAYEQLDEHTADRLEQELFSPAQRAYGRSQRTYAGFAARHGLATRTFVPASASAPSHGVRNLLAQAMQAVATADATLSTLQDSMLPVEVGDAELRAGLEEVRQLLAGLPGQARELIRTLGR